MLGGIALGALSGACLTVIMTRGGMEAAMILAWNTGASAQVDPTPAVASALGLPLARTKLTLLTVTALATGLSALMIGPVSFVGLVVPHLARAARFVRAQKHLAGSIVNGCGLMVAADLLCRLLFYPYQMPFGLFASLVGAPHLVWAVMRP